jgi:hypothetical protein
MDRTLTISRVARQCGMSVPNIRFYEAQDFDGTLRAVLEWNGDVTEERVL